MEYRTKRQHILCAVWQARRRGGAEPALAGAFDGLLVRNIQLFAEQCTEPHDACCAERHRYERKQARWQTRSPRWQARLMVFWCTKYTFSRSDAANRNVPFAFSKRHKAIDGLIDGVIGGKGGWQISQEQALIFVYLLLYAAAFVAEFRIRIDQRLSAVAAVLPCLFRFVRLTDLHSVRFADFRYSGIHCTC